MYKLAPRKVGAANQELAYVSPYSKINVLRTGTTTQGGYYPWYGDSSSGMGVPYYNKIGAFMPTSRFGVSSSFGKKKPKRKSVPTKKHTGWCIKKKRVVKVYKVKGLSGKRYYDKKKVPKRTRCYKTKREAQNAKGTRKRKYSKKTGKYYYVYNYDNLGTGGRSRHRHNAGKLGGTGCSRRYNQEDCGSNPNCKWEYGRCSTRGRGGHTSSYQGPMNKQGFGRVVNPANRYNYQVQQYATNVGTPTVKQMHSIAHTPAYQYPVGSMVGGNQTWYTPSQNLSGYGF